MTKEGDVYGMGKNNRYQLGKYQNEDTQHSEIFDKYQSAIKIQRLTTESELPEAYFEGEEIAKVACGKFHTIFLTKTGRVFSVGFNKYGQLGVSNSIYMHAEEPIEVFTDGAVIKDICAGWHHNLLLAEDGTLFGFGARQNG